MTGFFQVDRDIFTSSVWLSGSSEERVLWFWLLGNRDDDGVVRHRELAIADGAKLLRSVVEAILQKFSEPDPDSRTRANDGRRIARTPDGFVRILNHELYYSKDYSTPRWRKWNERQRANALANAQTPLATKDKDKDKDKDTTDNGEAPPAPAGPRRRRTDTAASSHPDASRFVAAFNATFGRRVSLTPKLARDFAARVADGYAAATLVALPLLVDAQGLPDELRKKLEPSWLLRNGERGYTTSDGERRPGKEWVEDSLQRADQTRLWPRHVTIAREAECLDELRRLGCRISEETEP